MMQEFSSQFFGNDLPRRDGYFQRLVGDRTLDEICAGLVVQFKRHEQFRRPTQFEFPDQLSLFENSELAARMPPEPAGKDARATR